MKQKSAIGILKAIFACLIFIFIFSNAEEVFADDYCGDGLTCPAYSTRPAVTVVGCVDSGGLCLDSTSSVEGTCYPVSNGCGFSYYTGFCLRDPCMYIPQILTYDCCNSGTADDSCGAGDFPRCKDDLTCGDGYSCRQTTSEPGGPLDTCKCVRDSSRTVNVAVVKDDNLDGVWNDSCSNVLSGSSTSCISMASYIGAISFYWQNDANSATITHHNVCDDFSPRFGLDCGTTNMPYTSITIPSGGTYYISLNLPTGYTYIGETTGRCSEIATNILACEWSDFTGLDMTIVIANTRIPNCKNLECPSTLYVNSQGTFTATYENGTATVERRVLAIFPSLDTECLGAASYFGDSWGGQETLSFNWTPTTVGQYRADCRAIDSGVAECRGACVTDSPVYECAGPDTTCIFDVIPMPTNTPTPTPYIQAYARNTAGTLLAIPQFNYVAYDTTIPAYVSQQTFSSVSNFSRETVNPTSTSYTSRGAVACWNPSSLVYRGVTGVPAGSPYGPYASGSYQCERMAWSKWYTGSRQATFIFVTPTPTPTTVPPTPTPTITCSCTLNLSPDNNLPNPFYPGQTNSWTASVINVTSGCSVGNVTFTLPNSTYASICGGLTIPCPSTSTSYVDYSVAYTSNVTAKTPGDTSISAVARLTPGASCSDTHLINIDPLPTNTPTPTSVPTSTPTPTPTPTCAASLNLQPVSGTGIVGGPTIPFQAYPTVAPVRSDCAVTSVSFSATTPGVVTLSTSPDFTSPYQNNISCIGGGSTIIRSELFLANGGGYDAYDTSAISCSFLVPTCSLTINRDNLNYADCTYDDFTLSAPDKLASCYTPDTSVFLHPSSTGATEMRFIEIDSTILCPSISNDDIRWGGWIPYSTNYRAWTLSPGTGHKKVCAQYRSWANEASYSAVCGTRITYTTCAFSPYLDPYTQLSAGQSGIVQSGLVENPGGGGQYGNVDTATFQLTDGLSNAYLCDSLDILNYGNCLSNPLSTFTRTYPTTNTSLNIFSAGITALQAGDIEITVSGEMSNEDIICSNGVLTPPTITAADPWWQVKGGNVITKGDVFSAIPPLAFDSKFIRDPVALLIYSTTMSFLPFGTISETNISAQAEVSTRPEASFDLFYNKKLPEEAKQAGNINIINTNALNETNLISMGSFGGGTYVEWRGYRIFYYDGSTPLGNMLTLNGDLNIADGVRIIIFVDNASVTINGTIKPVNEGRSSFLLIVEGNTINDAITVSPDVGGLFADGIPDLEGLFYTDGTFNTGTDGDDENLHIRGAVVANEIELSRDLGSTGETNDVYPGEYFEYGPEQVLAFPSFLRLRTTSWSEVAP